MAKNNKYKRELIKFYLTINGIITNIPDVYTAHLRKMNTNDKKLRETRKKYFVKKGNKEYIKLKGIEIIDKLNDSNIQTSRSLELVLKSQYVTLFLIFENYVRQIIKLSLASNKEILKQTEDNISLNEILEFSNINEMVSFSIDREVDEALRDKKSICEWIKKNFKIEIPNIHDLSKHFVRYNSIRNLIVHNNSIANKMYIQNCIRVGFNKNELPGVGKDIIITPGIFIDAVNNLYLMGIQIGLSLWINTIPKEKKLIEDFIIDEQAKFIENKKFHSAEIISNIANAVIREYSKKDIKYIIMINKAISLTFQKKNKLAMKVLEGVKSESTDFKLAIHLIKREFKLASLLMDKIDKEDLRFYYRHWPIFKLHRKTKILTKVYKKRIGNLDLYEVVKSKNNKKSL